MKGSWVGFALFCGFLHGLVFGDPDGFLSLSCGGTSYVDSFNISWESDSAYVSTGNTSSVDHVEGNSSAGDPIRYFPDPRERKCYKIPLKNNSSLVLVRARYVYRNYDGLNKPPEFYVSLGTAVASYVNLADRDPSIEEYIWPVSKDTLSFCLHGIVEKGAPAISSLEVRPLPIGAYTNSISTDTKKLLRKSYRINSGDTKGPIRYPMDQFDRIWDVDHYYTPVHLAAGLNTLLDVNFSKAREIPPASVLQTARVLARKDFLTYNLPLDALGDYYIILYFAGILPVYPSFDVIINDEVKESAYTVKSSEVTALYFTQKGMKSLNITLKRIKFDPLVSAIEVYNIIEIPPEASSTTVSALQVIEQSTGLDFGWKDDPCSPFPWDHIGCDGSLVTSLVLSDINLRSITPTFGDLLDLKSLDLHNTSLTGQIQNLGGLQDLEKLNLSFNQLTSFGTDLEDWASLQVLDLKNNSLQGIVPESLGELDNLRFLNLENNKLQDSLPQSLNRRSLDIRTSGNLCLSFSTMSCNNVSSSPSIETPQVTVLEPKRKHKRLGIILGGIAGAVAALAMAVLLSFFYMRRRGKKENWTAREPVDMRNWNAARVFTYKEIKAATNNFKEVIGRGSFGAVYRGKLSDGKQVAVKVRFDKSQLGAESFVNEVHLLSKIRHQNLVSLEGFCQEAKQQILVYEYLPNGSLADHLYGKHGKSVLLSWVRRLKIALDAAKGLDYLHNGSEPRIIHRDVKCSNILLDKDLNAKVCDFGLSKQVTRADATHVTTVVKGTAGYLDPEYYSTQQLTEKSDVYSFGVVLLELICGREPLTHSGSPDSFNLVLWAKPYLQAGAFEIVDESLSETFDEESMRRAASVAVRCVERDASERPTIAQILVELEEAYRLQLSHLVA